MQAVTLLEKFFQSDVIREVQGKKQYQFSEDGSCWYSFVTEPGPFNFVEKVKDGEENPTSPLGKRGRGGKKGKERKDEQEEEGTCFVNEYAVGGSEKVEGKGLESRRKSARLSMMDTNSSSISSCSTMTQISPTKVAEVWKELTLARSGYNTAVIWSLGNTIAWCHMSVCLTWHISLKNIEILFIFTPLSYVLSNARSVLKGISHI